MAAALSARWRSSRPAPRRKARASIWCLRKPRDRTLKVPPEVRIVDLAASRVLTSLPGLVRYLRRERPGALISVQAHANIMAIWTRGLARVQTKVVVSERNVGAEEGGRRGLRLYPALIGQFYPRVDGILAVSNGVADHLASSAGLSRDRIRVIYNPVVTPELALRAREALDHPWLAPGAPSVVLAAGRLTRQKDFPTLDSRLRSPDPRATRPADDRWRRAGAGRTRSA